MLTVGLIGAGSIAQAHLRGYVESGRVEAVFAADVSQEALVATSARFGIIKRTTTDWEQLVQDPSVDVVDICTPHYLHAQQAVAALQAGKHVILEKPMAITVEECDRILEAARQAGRRVFVALCQRMFPAHRKADELLQAGAIGQPFLGVINIYGDALAWMNDPQSWKGDWEKAGGGALIDTGHHAVYMLQHWFGRATAVTGVLGRLRVEPDNKADDTASATLEFGGKAMGVVTVTYAATGDVWTEERRIVGSEGSILIRDDPEDDVPLWLLQREGSRIVPVQRPTRVHPWGVAHTIMHFLECIEEGKAEEITAEEARAAVAACQAAYLSAREGRRVEIAEVDPAFQPGSEPTGESI